MMLVPLALLGQLALTSPTAPARVAEPAGDVVAQGWSARAALASKRLAGSGLDACDRGLERAFARAKVKGEGTKRTWLLEIEVEGERLPMLAAFGYEGIKLQDFLVVGLPPGWLLRQAVGSRTLSVLLSGPNCAFDLCPASPLSGAPCP